MDDNTFDKLIKEKLDHYEDQSDDASALVDFRERLISYSPVPWYVKYRTELLVAATLSIFTVVNAYLYKHRIQGQEKNTLANTNQINDHAQLIDSLTTVIQQLKKEQKTNIFVIDPTTQQKKKYSIQKNTVSPTSVWQHNMEDDKHNGFKFLLGRVASIPEDVLKVLQDEQLISAKDGQLYLVVSEERKNRAKSTNTMDERVLAQLHPVIQVHVPSVERKEIKIFKPLHEAPVSAKIRKALEKKYYAGVGINVAPHADLMQNIFSSGKGTSTPRLGITADWIVSPRLSVETALDYSTTKFNLNDDYNCINLADRSRPYGPLRNVAVITKAISTSVSIKYRDWISANSQAVFKLGYTPYVSLQHQYEFAYEYRTGSYGSYGNEETIKEVERKNERSYYGGTLAASAGIIHAVKKKTRLETSLFYEHSLGTMGVEKQHLQLFGLRTAYWFKLR